jgi:hypothetical protein
MLGFGFGLYLCNYLVKLIGRNDLLIIKSDKTGTRIIFNVFNTNDEW